MRIINMPNNPETQPNQTENNRQNPLNAIIIKPSSFPYINHHPPTVAAKNAPKLHGLLPRSPPLSLSANSTV